MSAWPSTWISDTLTESGIVVTVDTIAVMRAWKDSTPLPPYTNNPIGMPAGSMGAPSLLNTGYALFGSMGKFRAAFAGFIKSYSGQTLARAMISESPYAECWRLISSYGWPGSRTETDYPAVVLELTDGSYRRSVATADASARKTSGTIGVSAPDTTSVMNNARLLANASSAVSGASDMVTYLMRGSSKDG